MSSVLVFGGLVESSKVDNKPCGVVSHNIPEGRSKSNRNCESLYYVEEESDLNFAYWNTFAEKF